MKYRREIVRVPSEHIWDELELTYDWVTKVKGCSTFLMDADDLQTNPGQCPAVEDPGELSSSGTT